MSKYRKIDTRIWNDEDFRQLSVHAQLLFIFILTHPHLTSLGAMRISKQGLNGELRWGRMVFANALKALRLKPFVLLDEKFTCLYVPNFIKYNQPESPNVIKSWNASLDYIPECGLKYQLIQNIKAFVETLPEAFQKALPEAFRNAPSKPNTLPEPFPKTSRKGVCSQMKYPSGIHEQEQEHEHEQDLKSNKSQMPVEENAKSPKAQIPKVSIPPVECYQLAGILKAAILKRDPKARVNDDECANRWAPDIERLIRIDGRTAKEIEDVILWCQAPGCFWGPNILSGRKLREKFDTLWGQMNRDTTATQNAKPFNEPDFNPEELGIEPKK